MTVADTKVISKITHGELKKIITIPDCMAYYYIINMFFKYSSNYCIFTSYWIYNKLYGDAHQ